MITWKKGSLRGGAQEIEEVKGAIGVLLSSGNIDAAASGQNFALTRGFQRNTTNEIQQRAKMSELTNYVESQFRRAPMVNLDDVNWRKMANTGSYWDYNYSEIKTFQQLFRNLQLDGEKRNISRIVKQFMGDGEINDFNGTVECPICLKLNYTGGVMQDGQFYGPLYLVGGNSRLTVAKVLGIRPKIIQIDVDW